jgi:hypothetical protein
LLREPFNRFTMVFGLAQPSSLFQSLFFDV